MNNAPVIHCEKLSKTYVEGKLRVPVLHEVEFSVAPGERIAIVGASGAGKSTFLQLLGGLDKPSNGKIWVNGNDINQLSEREKGLLRNQHLGFVYQFHHLLPEFNALENVCIPLLVRGGIKPKHARQKASAYLEKVGLSHRQKHRVGELSGGEKQRVALARALVTEPCCVLADEPTGNLDQKTAEQVADLTLQLNRSLNISFVIVTHNREFADKMDRVLLLDKGQLQSESERNH
ncbi:lipoprotein-releasing ABC transporter ATP-binding protein LolD [Coxiella burnetii]|uniref:Lipoprotein-releasing system ATP-binding protein LolD n=2 Tax=Coxiella burnetii TaxID=777 RepID=LOLD_COXBU|nr:lipoprotein-releasing ABC transporter ATP-binding protein LolD [Coxiella burnetii]NP_820007.1 lipoprotein releasing system ATP-binding protein [Coxiella burnetii RSA 493]Q83CV2.1 RecName: Full=Lipoprotein-releasing system ATP-binding protein LolD [Coxiella burnetii RSA 493]AAO90521.1 lipoprotein releasing system ATP-binding protein [Coxiella burnetii RSA 493]ABS76651.1 lipoprotein releasing system ATP-binding protein [Coxiella burnetii Dugway 5J108-111]ABX79109.1 lipoprotein releasing syste